MQNVELNFQYIKMERSLIHTFQNFGRKLKVSNIHEAKHTLQSWTYELSHKTTKDDAHKVKKWALQYIKGILDHYLFYLPFNNFKIVRYSDNDQAGDMNNKKMRSRR